MQQNWMLRRVTCCERGSGAGGGGWGVKGKGCRSVAGDVLDVRQDVVRKGPCLLC